MSTIRFEESLINVRKNYTYSQFDKVLSEKDPEVGKDEKLLEELIAKREKLRDGRLVDVTSRGEAMVESLMVMSAELINLLLNTNLEKVVVFRDKVEDQLEKIIIEEAQKLEKI